MSQQARSATGRLSDAAPPLHQILRERMTEAILTGAWPAGTVLANEVALAAEFGVATGTLRRALQDLTAEGLLSRRRRTGTVVTGRAPRHSLRFLFRFFRLHDLGGALVEASAHSLALQRCAATAEEAAMLRLAADAEVIRFDRLRAEAGRPVMLDRFVLDAVRFAALPARAEEMPELLYLHLQGHFGLRIAAVREQLSAVAAGPDHAAALGLAPGAPLLVIEEIAYDEADRPAILALHHADTTAFRYVNELR